MIDKFVVVDYQEGAGGEFIARFISAHYGHNLEFDQQLDPDHIQKWLNSHSIVNSDWDLNFESYFVIFLAHCNHYQIKEIAVPYHLYKWPGHAAIISKIVNHTRFVKINCDTYIDKIFVEFDRKVLSRHIEDFSEFQFLLKNKTRDFISVAWKLYKQKKLTYRNIFSEQPQQLQKLPSNDIEIQYEDFFCNFEQTTNAYQTLCKQLDLEPNFDLLLMLLDRNKKNYQSLNNHLSNT